MVYDNYHMLNLRGAMCVFHLSFPTNTPNGRNTGIPHFNSRYRGQDALNSLCRSIPELNFSLAVSMLLSLLYIHYGPAL